MKWAREAEEAIAKVPFFVRKRVRKRVEEEAARGSAGEVRLEHVRACQRKFLDRMEDEVKGYQVETCFGPTGCPNRTVVCDDLVKKLETRVAKRNLRDFLKKKVKGPLKFHHEFRISISDCPNACSGPQIVDLGLIGAGTPEVSPERSCSECGSCVEICQEGAITLTNGLPEIDKKRCLFCGQCLKVCPTGTLREGIRGYRVLVGGKLGRHPRLGSELPGIFGEENALRVIDECLDYYQQHCNEGERLGEILERRGFETFLRTIPEATKKDEVVKSLTLVTPAKAGVQKCVKLLDSGSRPE